MSATVTRRILAPAGHPEDAMAEMNWIDNCIGHEGSFIAAVRHIQAMIDDGSMIVVREEPVP
jgi:hypothetical protein